MTPEANGVARRDVLDGDMLLPIAKHRVSFAVPRSLRFEIKCCHLPLSRHEVASMELDATDWKILRLLQSDARLSNVDLARQVGL
jgi:hypothetical protein